MTTLTTTPSSPDAVIARAATTSHERGLIGQYLQLTKARLSALVLLTTAVGYLLASLGGIDWARLTFTVIGTALAAGCASAINQLMETRRDSLMHRTRNRPLPSGTMTNLHATIAALAMGFTGIAMLAVLVNIDAAWMALLTILLYVVLYTPMKSRSTLNTFVGAICGALPPMIGWVAATGSMDVGGWVLGAILFVWQIPHFLALAWLYREDYQRGGYAMLPVIDRGGQMTCNIIVLTSLLLLPLGLMATLVGVAGLVYAIGSVILGLWMAVLSLRLHRHRTHANARGVFLASITYLPLLMCLLVIDRGSAF